MIRGAIAALFGPLFCNTRQEVDRSFFQFVVSLERQKRRGCACIRCRSADLSSARWLKQSSGFFPKNAVEPKVQPAVARENRTA
jgi:hypothetical protein